MNLQELGWDSFFEKHFNPYKEKDFLPARIAVKQGNVYVVYSELGELAGKVTGRFKHNARSQSDFPTVGDWVAVKGNPRTQRMTIHGVLPRRTKFSRKMVSTEGRVVEEQVISANIDIVFLIVGLDADFNIRRIERYLTIVQGSGARVVIILNKTDLCDSVDECIKEVEAIAPGTPIHAVCALKRETLEPLLTYVAPGETVTLVGSSGVGKSTIINTILGTERQKVGAVREKDGRGRHITAKRELIILPAGGIVIDNPGMRSVPLWGDQKGLEETFDDIVELTRQCKFTDCQHRTEPGCAIKKALEDGALDRDRYNNYLRLQRELRILAIKRERRARVR